MSETVSRRELNKARTRRALVEAARELGSERGLEHVTAEDIADRAGVSRRTFFNYFGNLESVVAAGLAEPLAKIAGALHERPAGEQPVEAITAALRRQPIPAEILLGWAPTAPPESAQGRELHLRVWQYHREWLVGVLRERMPAAPELQVTSLAASVMAIFEVVQEAWLPTALELEPEESVASFNELLVRALGHAGAGWHEPGGPRP